MRAAIISSRLITEAKAAAYVGLDLSTFRHWVACRRLPKPLAGSDLFDIRAIDAAVDRLSGLHSPANALDAWLASESEDAH